MISILSFFRCFFCFLVSFSLSHLAFAIDVETRTTQGWLLKETRPVQVKARVLLLPGLMETDFVYSRLLQESELFENGIQLVAANPPGFKGMPVGEAFDFSTNAYVDLLKKLTESEHFDLIVGHSFFANILIEALNSRAISQHLILVSPSLSRKSEPFASRFLDVISHIQPISRLAWEVCYLEMKAVLSGGLAHPDSSLVASLVSEAKLTSRWMSKRLLVSFFDGLRHRRDLVAPLDDVRTKVYYLHGDQDVVTLKIEDQARLEKNPNIKIEEATSSGHILMLDQPDFLANVIFEDLF